MEESDTDFLRDLAQRIFKACTPAMGFDQYDTDRLSEITQTLTTLTTENAALAARVEALEGALRVGDKVRVIGEYESDWRGRDAWLTGINADNVGLNYTIGEQWPVPYRHSHGYLGMTDGFREGELVRAALAGDPS